MWNWLKRLFNKDEIPDIRGQRSATGTIRLRDNDFIDLTQPGRREDRYGTYRQILVNFIRIYMPEHEHNLHRLSLTELERLTDYVREYEDYKKKKTVTDRLPYDPKEGF